MVSKIPAVPRRTTTVGMWLFLASLAVLFLASMVAYGFIRISNRQIPAGSIHLPKGLWASTLMMLASSYTIHCALAAIRREKQALFRIYLSATIAFASFFVLIQTPAMVQLYQSHARATDEWKAREAILSTQPAVRPSPANDRDDGEIITGRRSMPFYALVMVLILIHALHVIGGMIALGIVAYHGYRGFYDHEQHAGVTNCMMYWHFLDGVWLIMFTMVLAFG